MKLKTQLYIFIELRSKKEAAMFKHITLRDKLILQYFIDFIRRMSLPELVKPKTVYSKSHSRNITAKASVFLNYILTDNASAFKRLHHEEQSLETEEQFFKRFFYNPYSSFQKRGCERNHKLFRYIRKKRKRSTIYHKRIYPKRFLISIL